MNWYANPLVPFTPAPPLKRKVFISYCHLDQAHANWFVDAWKNVFTARALGVGYTEDIINSTNPEYVMARIREKYLGDSSVTILLVGTCTHSRRYIDWELKASMQRGTSAPNGVLALLLPYAQNFQGRQFPHLPERLALNYRYNDATCYACYEYMPTTEEGMRSRVEKAFAARTEKADAIVNPNEMWKNNRVCQVCGVTH